MPVGNNEVCGADLIDVLAPPIAVALTICTEAFIFVDMTFPCADAVPAESLASACSSSMAG